MKESASFSNNETENVSLNFSELREKGLEYIQELSGEVWTDFNAHDPGVTILEQLCYALTDIAYRTSFPIEDLLVPGEGLKIDALKNTFFAPSAILSSHPITLNDLKKLIIDRFDEIQNVWITTKENIGYQEQLNGTYQIEILPKLNFHSQLTTKKEKAFLTKIKEFLTETRNLGEDFDDICLLSNQNIAINFQVYIKEQLDIEEIIANLFVTLLEFVYCPIQYYSFQEMKADHSRLERVFSGPKLNKGFIKNEDLKNRIKIIHVDEIQKLFTKIDGVLKCNVTHIENYNGKTSRELEVAPNKFFHVFDDSFETIYSKMNVFVNNNKITLYNKEQINSLFFDKWSKKYRDYAVGDIKNDAFEEKLNATYQNPTDYYSIQNHFPNIYGIGSKGISRQEPKERHAKALQLKAYLLFFEQHLANHLAQIGHIDEFFNSNYLDGVKQTYFTQKLSSVPQIEKLEKNENLSHQKKAKPDPVFFERKNRVFNHLLARFGEHLSDIPWKIAWNVNMIKTEDEFWDSFLQKKSEFLQHIDQLSYQRTKGESFVNGKRNPSGLEQIIVAKTGILPRDNRSLVDNATYFEFEHENEVKRDKKNSIQEKEIKENYRGLNTDEIENRHLFKETIQDIRFKGIRFQSLFQETLDYNNYRISKAKGLDNKIEILFRQKKNEWISLLKCSSEKKAISSIHHIVSHMIEQNKKSEGLYIVDHIMLRDCLRDTKYGFCFLDQYNMPLFRTIEDESWLDTEEDRNDLFASLDTYSYSFFDEKWIIKNKDRILVSFKTDNPKFLRLTNELQRGHYCYNKGKWVIKHEDHILRADINDNENLKILTDELKTVYKKAKRIIQFFEIGLNKDSYSFDNGKWVLKNPDGIILASYAPKQTEALDQVYKKTKHFIQLFNDPYGEHGRLRLEEMESLRSKGSKKEYRQRRLVFQRKLPNGKIINEDFFDLNVSILLPDWPARFQDEQFRAYVSDLVHERIPAHLSNDIIWLDKKKLEEFEKVYFHWGKLKSRANPSKESLEKIAQAAYTVYEKITNLKQTNE
ncbi:hypothetical protein D1816_17385 [Aquimarina sp. AD10]|uniref:hypothetical protein n=1 Tax=Aquimarina sp. AD10 TaxID=1714849 RepID=UPI000E53C0BB|nr:hypothetical protein [Aquimarina sp. AD10]AXT62054.1 hypothetical protein D1816_17385 [Aquimarina sp. AD10]RKM99958.1 hypothetical protein D7033_10195 [Aquimarina sp. AD10]